MLLGFAGSIVSAILRSIPNYINRTRFAFWCMVPVTIALLFLLILLFISPNLKRKIAHIYENLFSAAILVCSLDAVLLSSRYHHAGNHIG